MSNGVPQLCFDKVREYFNGDIDKTWTWMRSPNPRLGMVSPLDMLRVGRAAKLLSYINYSIDDGRRL